MFNPKAWLFLALLSMMPSGHATEVQISLKTLHENLLKPTSHGDFKYAFQVLKDLAETSPNNSSINKFMGLLIVETSSTKNAEKFLYLWKSYSATVETGVFLNSLFFTAIERNIYSSPPPVRKAAIDLLEYVSTKAYLDQRFYTGLHQIVRVDHQPLIDVFSKVYGKLLTRSDSKEEARKHANDLLVQTKFEHIKLATLKSLTHEDIAPLDSAIDAAVTLMNSKHPHAINALEYLNLIAEHHPETLAPFESKILSSLKAILYEKNQSRFTDSAESLVIHLPNWHQNSKAATLLLKDLLMDEAPKVAKSTASKALVSWHAKNKSFFDSLVDTHLKTRVAYFASAKGSTIHFKNCKQLLIAMQE